MADFTPITTQEDFDKAINSRLDRERRKAIEPYQDYEQIKSDLAAANKTLGEKDATIAELSNQLKGARADLAKTRTALAKGLPLSVVESLRGETEEELGKSADALSVLMQQQTKQQLAEPAKSTAPAAGSGVGAKDEGYAQLLEGLHLDTDDN